MTSNAQNRMPHDIKDDAGNIKEDLNQLKDDLHKTGQHAMAHGKDLGNKVMEKGREQAEYVKECAQDTLESARHYAKEKPMMVMAAAFGIGVVAGLLLRGR